MRKLMRIGTRAGCGLLLFAAVVGALPREARAAQVHVSINIGAPPPVIVRHPPTMVYLPEPRLYSAVGIPYDVFFVDGRYFYFRNNNWFWAPGYGGPWTYVEYRALPSGLRKVKVERLREFRDREYRVYRSNERSFSGKHFVADYGPQGKGRGRGHSKH